MTRESISPEVPVEYVRAFREVEFDPNNEVIVGVNDGRTDAIRFYKLLGFRATHEGMKLEL
jgi:hypothetical protein